MIKVIKINEENGSMNSRNQGDEELHHNPSSNQIWEEDEQEEANTRQDGHIMSPSINPYTHQYENDKHSGPTQTMPTPRVGRVEFMSFCDPNTKQMSTQRNRSETRQHQKKVKMNSRFDPEFKLDDQKENQNEMEFGKVGRIFSFRPTEDQFESGLNHGEENGTEKTNPQEEMGEGNHGHSMNGQGMNLNLNFRSMAHSTKKKDKFLMDTSRNHYAPERTIGEVFALDGDLQANSSRFDLKGKNDPETGDLKENLNSSQNTIELEDLDFIDDERSRKLYQETPTLPRIRIQPKPTTRSPGKSSQQQPHSWMHSGNKDHLGRSLEPQASNKKPQKIQQGYVDLALIKDFTSSYDDDIFSFGSRKAKRKQSEGLKSNQYNPEHDSKKYRSQEDLDAVLDSMPRSNFSKDYSRGNDGGLLQEEELRKTEQFRVNLKKIKEVHSPVDCLEKQDPGGQGAPF